MRQINAGLKKELLFFWRSFRLGGIIIAFIGCALFMPLMWGMMAAMGMEDLFNQMGLEQIENGELFVMYSGSLSMIISASIVMLILMMGTAGAEQKKRSIIIPQTAGLTPSGYVLPKFMFYPMIIFIMTVISAFIANAACHAVLNVSYSFEPVLITGSLVGLYMMFLVCFYLFMGIALVQPGLSILYVLAADMVFSEMLRAFGINRFTPWSLPLMTDAVLLDFSNISNIVTTAVITLFICFVFMLLTLFAMVAKRMDNTADEVY
jgi:ABC-2 type transport system permease protein